MGILRQGAVPSLVLCPFSLIPESAIGKQRVLVYVTRKKIVVRIGGRSLECPKEATERERLMGRGILFDGQCYFKASARGSPERCETLAQTTRSCEQVNYRNC